MCQIPSMENQVNLNNQNLPSHAYFNAENFKDEIPALSVEQLQMELKKLQFLGFNIDPFNCMDLSTEEENLVREFKLEDDLRNPFSFTNKLLQMIDSVETHLNKKQH